MTPVTLTIGEAIVVALGCGICSVVGTWAVFKFQIGQHEKRLEDGQKEFKDLHDKIQKKADITNNEINKKIKEHAEACHILCDRKHGEHSRSVANIESSFESKIIEGDKCLRVVKLDIAQLKILFKTFHNECERRLEDHTITLKQLPNLLRESTELALKAVIQEVRKKDE